MTVTYHRSKERAENRRYSMLLALRDGPRCGHPVAASTNFCLKCHQERHKKALGIRVRMTATLAPSA